MKKNLITSTLLFIGLSVLLTSCLSTGTVSNRTLTLPESPEAAARKIVELENKVNIFTRSRQKTTKVISASSISWIISI